MNIKIILSFIAFTVMFSAFGQDNAAIDSLKNILKTAKADTTKVNNMNALSNQYRIVSEYKMAMQYAEFALDLASTMSYKKGIADSYKSIGYIYEDQGNYPESLENYFAWLKISEEIGDKKGIADAFYWIGSIYELQRNYQKASENYLESLKICEEIGDKIFIANRYYWIGHRLEYYQCNYSEAMENFIAALKVFQEIGKKEGIANCYIRLGNIYLSQGNHPEALGNFLSSLKISEEIEDKRGYARICGNIGNVYKSQGNYPEALEFYLTSLKVFQEIGNKRGIAGTYSNIGVIYLEQGNYPEALEYFSSSLKISEEIGDKGIIAYLYNNFGEVYNDQGNYTEALKNYIASLKLHEENGDKENIVYSYLNIGENYCEQGNYQDARIYLEDGLALSKEIGVKPVLLASYYSLSKLDSAEGNFAQAQEHYKMYILYKDSIVTEEIKNQMALMKIQYETEKKDREIELLNKGKELQEQKLEKQTLIRNGMIAGIVLIVLLGLLIFRSFRLRKRLEKQEAIIQERHRISADLHDDVGSGLSKITLLSELLKTQAKTPENRKEAEKISDTALEVSSTISEIIWALNSNNDYLENMVAYIRRYAAEYFENSPVKLNIVTQGEILPTPINGEHRRNIFYTVKEALNNILKHSEATEAELKFVVMDGKLDVIISDNGKGIPDGDLNRFGNGINNMQARMKSISGVFKIENHQGTRISLKLAI